MAELTHRKRSKLKRSQFALPGKRKYPIEDRSHAKNALARVSQFGSAKEKATVRRKVHARYPSIGVKGMNGGKRHGHRKRVSAGK